MTSRVLFVCSCLILTIYVFAADEKTDTQAKSAKGSAQVESAQAVTAKLHTKLKERTEFVCPVYESPPGSGMYYAKRCSNGTPTGLVAPPGLPAGSCSTASSPGSSCQPSTYYLDGWAISKQALPGHTIRPAADYVPELTPGSKIIGSFIVDFRKTAASESITTKLFLILVPGPAGDAPIVIGWGVEVQPGTARPDHLVIGAPHVVHIMDHLYRLKFQDAAFMVFTHIAHP